MFEVRFQYKTQILVELQKKQNLHISELVQLIFDLNIKMERFSIKIAPKHIIFDYSWDKKETNKLFRLVCLFCEDRTIEMFLRFRCLDLNTLDTIILHHSVSVFKVFYSVISISVPPIKTTLIFSFDSTTTHSMSCLTSLSSYSIGWFCSPSSMV